MFFSDSRGWLPNKALRRTRHSQSEASHLNALLDRPRGERRMKAELERLNQVWTRAWLDRDAAVVDRIMGPEFVYIAPSGQILDRQTMLAIIRSSTYSLTSGGRTEVSVVSLGPDAAAVVSRWQGEGSYEGRAFRDDHRCTSVFVRQGADWRMFLEHCSAILVR